MEFSPAFVLVIVIWVCRCAYILMIKRITHTPGEVGGANGRARGGAPPRTLGREIAMREGSNGRAGGVLPPGR